MENFVIGGDVFEKYIGKIGFGEDMQMQGGQNHLQEMERRHKLAARELKAQFEKLLTDIHMSKSTSVQTIIADAQSICSMPANREVLKYFG